MIDETVKKLELAIKHARTAKKAELIKLLEEVKREVQAEKRSHILKAADEDLREAAIEFDAAHPQLGAVLGEVSMLLAKIGI
jgi:mRNA-degrading endonuclease YafQ of YafQ-DinJ toxin-antitoxin module